MLDQGTRRVYTGFINNRKDNQMQKEEITQQEIINVKEYNRKMSADVQKFMESFLAWDIAKANIRKAKRCFVWTKAFNDGEGVYVRVYKNDLLKALDCKNCDSIICNEFKVILRDDGDLYID
jgi:hypothetical protein